MCGQKRSLNERIAAENISLYSLSSFGQSMSHQRSQVLASACDSRRIETRWFPCPRTISVIIRFLVFQSIFVRLAVRPATRICAMSVSFQPSSLIMAFTVSRTTWLSESNGAPDNHHLPLLRRIVACEVLPRTWNEKLGICNLPGL